MSREQLTAIVQQANDFRAAAFAQLKESHPTLGRALLHGHYDGFGKVAGLAAQVLHAGLPDSGSIRQAISELTGPPIPASSPDAPALAYAVAFDNALAWGRDRLDGCLQ